MSMAPLHKLQPIFIFLSSLIILITIWVWRTENISFSQSEAKEHIPVIHLITSNTNHQIIHTPQIKVTKNTHTKQKNRKIHNKHSNINELSEQDSKYGINTAPYDLSDLHIYGLNEYCTQQYKNKIEYMDITGMYDTGTNTFYQVLTKNCWGRETKMIDYITAYPPESATDEEQKQFHEKANMLYDSERPKVLASVPVFKNVKWKPLTGKHHAISAVNDFIDSDWNETISNIRKRLTLVIIKDPLTWFKSLCKAPYEVHFWNKQFRINCPFGIAKKNGKFSANMWHSVKFASLVELWNWWYGTWTDSGNTISVNWKPTFEYWNYTIKGMNWRHWMTEEFVNTNKKYMMHKVNKSRFDEIKYYKSAKDIPHLVIRYEDILFQPERLIDTLCKCVGGYVRTGGPVIQESAAKGHGFSRGRQKALQTYGNPKYRYDKYPVEDLKLINETLNKTLLNFFSYNL